MVIYTSSDDDVSSVMKFGEDIMALSNEHEMSTRNPRAILAIIMVLISALAIGVAPVCAKLAYLGGSNSYSLITARNLMMTTCLGLGLLCFGRSFRLPMKSLIIALAMGPIYVLLSFGYLGAVAYIPVDLAILIYFLHPLLIGILVRVIGQETVSRIRYFALCLALLGLVIAIGATAVGLSAFGIGLALMSAIACTIMIVGNAAAMKQADCVLVIFYMVFSATIILAVAHILWNLELAGGRSRVEWIFGCRHCLHGRDNIIFCGYPHARGNTRGDDKQY